MRDLLGRLLFLIADTLDRNLVTVPDIDEYDPATAALQTQARLKETR